MSDFKIFILSICGGLMGNDSENAWYPFVKRNYRHLFPRLAAEPGITGPEGLFCR